VTIVATGLPDLNGRIERMFLRDRLAAGAFVIVLWLVIGFVFLQISPLAGRAISAVLFAAAGLVAVFNTASIVAMIRHYRHEKARIYGLDIEHLDALREAGFDARPGGDTPAEDVMSG
jgi:hypothetical protein